MSTTLTEGDLESGKPSTPPPESPTETDETTNPHELEQQRSASRVEEPPLEDTEKNRRKEQQTADGPPRKDTQLLLLQLATYSILVFITIWGVLARLGLEWIGGFAEGQVFTTIWPQVVGCFVMGAVTDRKKGLESVLLWISHHFLELDERCLLCVRKPRLSTSIQSIHQRPLFYIGAILLLILGPATYRSRATFAIVLGPPGTLLRFELSKRLNSRNKTFPIGTFAANTIAVFFIALASMLQRRGATGALGCAALQGLKDGFCGSLSTVSTFVVELRNLGRRESWRYFGI
ncbi:hypothetical protein MNV49_005638 [Pseudohyphozyma bogoriensis]|nr:hypothetical protein MNV49_005638 [Pseudohyphozyma bogoriensis]